MKTFSTILFHYRSLISFLSLVIMLWAAHAPQIYNMEADAKNLEFAEALESPRQEQDPAPNYEFKLVTYQAVLPMIYASLPVIHYLIFKLEKVKAAFNEEVKTFQLPFLSYFNTLFRLIISPNAP